MAINPQATPASGIAANAGTPAKTTNTNNKYPPSPTKACCPIETTPAYPASKFQSVANVSVAANSNPNCRSELSPSTGNTANTSSPTANIAPVLARIMAGRFCGC